ncbi:MAG: MFS transporter [Gemmatimonadota bacterium]
MLWTCSRAALGLGAAVLVAGCGARAAELLPSDAASVLANHTIDAPDPSRTGPFEVGYLTYGSGEDRNREAFRDSVVIRTESVDASKFVSLGSSARERNRFWGFPPSRVPLNARVWYPEGEGPFPLVLVVHGNHNMRDYSDPGYDYLGELLASRGFILASVDMNFINGGIRGENDARGWLLLKHLEAWRAFNEDEGTPFHGRVDMSRIALMGHSRGGEAVAHAAAFNRLERYPDDGNVTFDFDFDIRSVVAIAPVDGQYAPADRLQPVENVNYMVFHGSHDGDVSGFMGIRQYQRVRFTDGQPWLKALVYVYRANHGQWNTVWGSHDRGPRSGRSLDLDALMPAEEQRQFARVYITAFLEATLKGKRDYLPLFRDHRVAGDWLPPTMYVTRVRDHTFRPLATFEEDVDLTGSEVAGLRLQGDSLSTWREGRLQLRTANSPTEGSSQYNHAVWLGWNNRIAGEDTTDTGPPASYTLTLPDGLAADWRLDDASVLQFELMPTGTVPRPRAAPKTDADSTAADEPAAAPPARAERNEEADKPPVDLSIEVEDARGVRASVPLSRYGPLRRPLPIAILRRADLERERYGSLHELVFQTFTIPLADLVAVEPRLDLGRLAAVRFRFDCAFAGEVIVDDIGFARPDPAFLRAPVPVADAQGAGGTERGRR